MKFTFGSDPEFILVDHKNQPKSAIPVLKKDKDDRIDLRDGHAAYYDNVLAEANIRPGSTSEEVIGNFRECFQRYANVVKPLRIRPQASANFSKSDCNHEDAKRFGCNPEYCAYLLEAVQPPEPPPTFRSCGGHIHLGKIGDDYPLNDPYGCVALIRTMDLFIGVPSVLIDQDPTSAARRKLYGKSGTHRPTEYGVEYRSIGNFWLASPELVRLIYSLSNFCLDFVNQNHHKQFWSNIGEGEDDTCSGYDVAAVRNAIDTTNVEEAGRLMGFINELYPAELKKEVGQFIANKRSFDFYESWGI